MKIVNILEHQIGIHALEEILTPLKKFYEDQSSDIHIEIKPRTYPSGLPVHRTSDMREGNAVYEIYFKLGENFINSYGIYVEAFDLEDFPWRFENFDRQLCADIRCYKRGIQRFTFENPGYNAESTRRFLREKYKPIIGDQEQIPTPPTPETQTITTSTITISSSDIIRSYITVNGTISG